MAIKIRKVDITYLRGIQVAACEIRNNVQRGGRAGCMDIDDWAKEIVERVNTVLAQNPCIQPPKGWRCTRGGDHYGSCAAVPTFLTRVRQWLT